jgi:glycerol-3-phosphate dehydrogenase
VVSFAFSSRPEITRKLIAEHYDLLVIGGGITGAGIALDAASRGVKTALVEKNDFAFGTSSRSTKLIHGGLRYLKQLEFGLVKEVGSERAVVHKLAPHLVIPEKMLLPLSDKKGPGYWLTSIGLKIYDWLAGVKEEDQRRMLTKQQTLRYEPLLKKDDVNGGAIYAEYRTDDARLTIEVVKAAVGYGADVLSYCEVEDFVYNDRSVSGVSVVDRLSGQKFGIAARAVVSAAGPWVDDLREINKSKTGKRLHLTKGVHIVVPHHRLPVRQAIYFDVADGRMIFAIPRWAITYVGTTDTSYKGDKDRVTATLSDAQYLIDAVNATFPSVTLTVGDVVSSWAGLRPLIHEEGKSESELSRKDEIFESSSGLISIAGGKLTGYRKMADRVVSLVIKRHLSGQSFSPCRTDQIALAGKGFASAREAKRFTISVAERLRSFGLPSTTAQYLVETYGNQTEDILNFAGRMDSESPDLDLLRAELWYCVHHEMVCTLADFFFRRTGLAHFNIDRVVRWQSAIAEECRTYFGWQDEQVSSAVGELSQLVESLRHFE